MERSTSVEEDKRRSTFKPPFNPDGKFTKDRHDEENFTFSKREGEDREGMKNYMKSAENPFKMLLKNKTENNIIIEEIDHLRTTQG